ncbi:MAG: hypothetical protein SGILL_006222 [Bacillariaceae sp.]
MSHFTTIATKLYNQEQLLKALGDLGIDSVESKSTSKDNENTLTARGYQGDTFQNGVDIVIRQPNDYDIAFSWNGETYELVADLQFWQQSMPVSAWMEKVQQRYALHNLVDTASQDGFVVEQVKESATDGSITMSMSRYNAAGM